MTLSYPATRLMLVSRVRTRLLTSSAATDHWPDAKIHDYLNRAQGEVQDELLEMFDERYFVRQDLDIVPNGKIIQLPPDWLRVLGLDVSSGSTWLPVKLIHPSRTIEQRYGLVLPRDDGTLVHGEVWSQIGENLEAQVGTPSAGPYRLRYTYRVPDLQTDESVSEIPMRFIDLVVDCTAARCAADGAQPQRAAILEADYQKGLDRLRRTAGRNVTIESKRVRRVRGMRWY